MRLIRPLRTICKYGAGVLCWTLVFVFLHNECIFNIGSFVDRLWVTELHDDLVENILGEVALHVTCGRCVDDYLYTVSYNPNGMDMDGERRSLTSLVDISTWKEMEADLVTVTYTDSRHRYRLYTFDQCEYIMAEDR